MSQVAIIGGVLLLVCCSSLSSVAMTMGGGDDTPKKTSSGGSGAVGPTATAKEAKETKETKETKESKESKEAKEADAVKAVDPPPPPKYTEFPGYDFTGDDIECSTTEADACQAKCDANDKCVSYIHISGSNGCCTKYGTPNYTYLPDVQITGFIKNIDGYEVEEVGDRPAGDIEYMRPTTISQCKTKCDSLTNCIGFNFRKDMCWIKKADGISPTYVNNGFQFYTKN